MNAKLAKKYRKLARKASVGLPKVKYLRHKGTGQIVVDPRSERGVYLAMKRSGVAHG